MLKSWCFISPDSYNKCCVPCWSASFQLLLAVEDTEKKRKLIRENLRENLTTKHWTKENKQAILCPAVAKPKCKTKHSGLLPLWAVGCHVCLQNVHQNELLRLQNRLLKKKKGRLEYKMLCSGFAFPLQTVSMGFNQMDTWENCTGFKKSLCLVHQFIPLHAPATDTYIWTVSPQAGNPLPAASRSVTISGPPVNGNLEAAERQRHRPVRGGLADRKRHQEPPEPSTELQLPAGDGRRGRGGRRPGGPRQSGAPRRPGQWDKQLAGVRGPQRAALPAA